VPHGAEDATRERPGMLAVVQHHLAADDVVHAFRALRPPGHTGGPVVGYLVLFHPDARRLEGQPTNRVFEAQELPCPPTHPIPGRAEIIDRKDRSLRWP